MASGKPVARRSPERKWSWPADLETPAKVSKTPKALSPFLRIAHVSEGQVEWTSLSGFYIGLTWYEPKLKISCLVEETLRHGDKSIFSRQHPETAMFGPNFRNM